ncbi:MAG TPA: HWE histidine kinase domain-containing protein [Rhizomicrobium sp.]|nr:HWE histidine kinase domain-containing protein [Rhizomicrobium sp.]
MWHQAATLRRLSLENVSAWRGVALALGAAGASLLLHWAVEPFFEPDRALIVFIPATVIVTLIAGPRFGVLTATISGIAIWYATLVVNHFTLSHVDIVTLCIYIVSSAIVIILVQWLRESQAQESLLRRELQHRTKNLFALVHGLAYETIRGEAPVSELRGAFLARLAALGRANETMGDFSLDRVDVELLIGTALKSFSDRFECHGPEAYLDVQMARNLSLALHELATNSTKYGAFSTPSGRVQLVWRIGNPGRRLDFVWKECGGPPVSPPTRKGFGSRLLENLFDDGEMEFACDGLSYRVEIPLASV